ncbi:MAG: phosphoenolpyruvate carboxykinase (GTP), partial [Ruminiclostridium sp.]|nr:phosphoenolpyruvate carboxykinase (GTP) [Ruminiclostridium sp.]
KKLGENAPKIFNVNWFKQDENGNFIWPGFGDNMRVLDWIIKRCEGTIDAEETAIGYLPKKGDINLEGIEDEVTSEVEDLLLEVDRDLWLKEVDEMTEFYKQFGEKLPAELTQELADLKARLG